ncbi:HPr kinase/phosphorylase [Lacibacterium aquatile]|uniref:HPr kinase/phosphorylase n=1 Tax=Lacibacterium aquatile TaxID=1168082 RepID=A0ABW5DZY0_9PROT
MSEPFRLHATCVALGDVGVLLRGPSGSGKSDLALRLIDGGAELVGDDQVMVMGGDGLLTANPHHNIAGQLEVRGLGILTIPHRPIVVIQLVVHLGGDQIERLPDPQYEEIQGVRVPSIRLNAFEASAPAKVRLAAGRLAGDSR